MNEYEMRIMIDELEKLVVLKTREIALKDYEITDLKAQVERLEAQAETKKENK
jgi:polyhydroxyalkanoate synthesis regulator phasin